MSDYIITEIRQVDRRRQKMMEKLLQAEGIRKDRNLDYTCGMFDEDGELLATGSCFGNTLRCLAVESRHRGEGLMNEVVSHLVSVQMDRGNVHLFLYTKSESAPYFSGLGFYKTTEIPGQIVFMENRRNGLENALRKWQMESGSDTAAVNETAAIIMNANPFTLGHQYLVEQASREKREVHLFVVSEDRGPIPASVRKELVRRGTAHLDNVILHDCGPYMISSATFPAYFQKDEEAVIRSQAALDASIFLKIADRLEIGVRYVGEEPTSFVTGIYNRILEETLPQHGLTLKVIPRLTYAAGNKRSAPVSASAVRQALKEKNMDLVKKLVPVTTLDYFLSPEAVPVFEAINAEENVIHY